MTKRVVSTSIVEPRSGIYGRRRPPLTVMVPFYKNAHLVRPLFESIRRCQTELESLGARVVFYNDSPGEPALQVELQRALAERQGLSLAVVENSENLGFVGSVNAAFDRVNTEGGDIILVNSDTVVFPGCFREMAEVAYADPMIGFVSPRSNNATLATFPHGADKLDLTPEEHYARYKKLAHMLPRWTYTPVAIGFCLYIKGSILRDLGGFDVAYGKGYNEENDLICRANRYGYRAAIANHAYTWHQGEQSFGGLDEGKAKRDAENAKLLDSRYPEYFPLVRNYFDSPEYIGESLLSGMAPEGRFRQRIGFDFSNFVTHHNGTFEAGKRLLEAASTSWPDDIELVVLCDRKVFEFHGMQETDRLRWCDAHDPDIRLTAVVRMGQIFDSFSLSRLLIRAPVVGVFMLDTISADCGYLRVGFDESLWSFTMKHIDVVFGISQFTVDQIERRYPIGDRTQLLPVLLSTALHEYAPQPPDPSPTDASGGLKRLLVIGNKFDHKGLDRAVTALAEGLPETELFVLGLRESQLANVTPIASGDLTDEETDALYKETDAVVFPTHYEGFGFPVMHAIARGRPIYVRRLPVFEEIADSFDAGAENIRWFEDHQDLVAQLQAPFRHWIGGPARGEMAGWQRCADQVFDAMQEAIARVEYNFVTDRLRWFQALHRRPHPEPPPPPPSTEDPASLAANFFGDHARRMMLAIFRNKITYGSARLVWRLLRNRRKSD